MSVNSGKILKRKSTATTPRSHCAAAVSEFVGSASNNNFCEIKESARPRDVCSEGKVSPHLYEPFGAFSCFSYQKQIDSSLKLCESHGF